MKEFHVLILMFLVLASAAFALAEARVIPSSNILTLSRSPLELPPRHPPTARTVASGSWSAHEVFLHGSSSSSSNLSDGLLSVYVQIRIVDFDLASEKATLDISFEISFPSGYPPNSLICDVKDILTGNTTTVVMRRSNGSSYSFTTTSEIPRTTTSFYPFDRYPVEMNMTLWLPTTNQTSTLIEYSSSGRAAGLFDTSLVNDRVQVGSDQMQISFVEMLTRKPTLLMQSIYAIFVMLGSTAWLSFRREQQTSRLRILLGLFTFVVLLYFNLGPTLAAAGVSDIIGVSVPQVLLMCLVWSIVAYTVITLLVLHAEESGLQLFIDTMEAPLLQRTVTKDHMLNFTCAAMGMAITVFFIRTSGLQGTLDIPELRNAVVFGLFYAAVGRLLLHVVRYRRTWLRGKPKKMPQDRETDAGQLRFEYRRGSNR